ncbi:hypothetical protein HYPSUDRAFT_55236 [Hypholoma sublateritium FD-334 SS-4]|uniref:Uncharacterized protein n=1 Tax=Hypholoma sublateritium (strain FD-334 SS-4) TaxID=945553 RepID=A0A0D2PPU7_HYPSF|nr:hypothetical protein HYPSUDRAFT_55236 [Hypholoma sublateritium FD-334 SS-4]
MIAFEVLFFVTVAYALPTPNGSTSTGPELPFIDSTGQVALLWTSIGLAVVTSFLQGLITTIVAIAEDQDMWTFRFRIALYEHTWWTTVSTMLFASFVLLVFSFLAGNSSNSLDVLTLSTATAIAVVRYAVPAWRNRSYIKLRWLAWTGPSRTGLSDAHKECCGSKDDWKRIQDAKQKQPIIPTPGNPTDGWGWYIIPPTGIWQDPTDLLKGFDKSVISTAEKVTVNEQLGRVYNDGYTNGQVSLLWGEKEGFRRRVSRAMNSVPSSLRSSIPSTFDGFGGSGLCLAMGILGRNKGLRPSELVYNIFEPTQNHQDGAARKINFKVVSELEKTSAWYPRPNKVMRSFYQKAMEEQYSGLGPQFVAVAVELALILLDCPPSAIMRWLQQNLEQQSIEVNHALSYPAAGSTRASDAQLQTLYRASYTSMILSINYFNQSRPDTGADARRPDLSCFALLWIARGGDEPQWWKEPWVKERLRREADSLEGDWKKAAALLLGWADVPSKLDLTSWPVRKPPGKHEDENIATPPSH